MVWLRVALAIAILAAALAVSQWLLPSELAVSQPPEPADVLEPAEVLDAGALLAPTLNTPRSHREPSPLSEALCPPAMAWIDGEFCAAGFVGREGCRVETYRIGVCIDLFEYPNQPGVLPATMSTFNEAAAACDIEGKRLCRDSEWTLACRGSQELTDCQFGLHKPEFSRERLWDPSQTARELSRVDGRRASGRSGCVSERGVFDLPGNLEEWVQAQGSGGYDAALKGGHFNKSSIGCERTVYVRQIHTRSPHVGFRCCTDPLVEPPER